MQQFADIEAIVADFYRSEKVVAGNGRGVAVALSGGSDSVALLAATVKAGVPTVALHCNFALRGEESKRDEAFARELATRIGCQIEVAQLPALAMKQAGESVEMACRRLRYAFFDKYMADHPEVALLAVGHHSDDQVETVMLNLLRGSGLKGVSGMPKKRGYIVRPLLEVSRSDILNYLATQQLGYVTDSSNLTSDYRRNFIRHDLMPLAESRFAGAKSAVLRTADNCRRDESLLSLFVGALAADCVSANGRSFDLPALENSLRKLLKATVLQPDTVATALWHVLRSRGLQFSYPTVCNMVEARQRSGLRFATADRSTVLSLDFDKLNVMNTNVSSVAEIAVEIAGIESGTSLALDSGMAINFSIITPAMFAPDRNGNSAWFDLDALAEGGTLHLRRWRESDRMVPFGMKGTKLVSDLLTEAQCPAGDRPSRWLVTDNTGEILWVPGVRASRHFAVSAGSSRILKLTVN